MQWEQVLAVGWGVASSRSELAGGGCWGQWGATRDQGLECSGGREGLRGGRGRGRTHGGEAVPATPCPLSPLHTWAF